MIDPKEFLERNRLYHADMLDALSYESTDVLYSEEDGVMLQLNYGESGPFAISAKTPEAMEKMAKLVGKDFFGVARPFKFLPILTKGRKPTFMVCRQIAYFKNELLEENNIPGITFKPLTEENLDFVMQEYDDDEGYLFERIKAGMLGAFNKKGECVGFIGTHGEGSVGLLKVLPEYRRMGIGFALESRMINAQIKKGKIPFGHVVVGNEKSLGLQKKAGMEISGNLVTWLFED